MSEMPRISTETAHPFTFRSPAPPGMVRARKSAPAGLKTDPALINPAELPRQYALLLDGDCMEPRIPDRGVGIMDREAPFAPGDVVCIWLDPERVAPGGHRAWMKKLSAHIPPFVTFPWREHPDSEMHAMVICDQINPPRRYCLPCTDIVAVHKVIGFLPPGSSRPGQMIDPDAMTRF